MPKKPHWRRGVVISRDGEPDRPARASDAERFLDLSIAERDPKRERGLLLSAQISRRLGVINEKLGFHRHTGRPKGATSEAKYDAALQAMMEISGSTSEKRPRTLAKAAVAAGHAPKDVQPGSAIKQLVILWNRRLQKKD